MNALNFDHDYPVRPGHRGVDTSIQAAEQVAPVAGRLRKMALAAIRASGDLGLTAEQLSDALGEDFVSVQPRTSELKVLGLIEPSGLRRRNRRGNSTIVWVAAQRQGKFALIVPQMGDEA